MPRSPHDKFPLIEIRRIIREIYFRFDELSDEEFDALVDNLNNTATTMRSVAQERRNERANKAPRTPQG